MGATKSFDGDDNNNLKLVQHQLKNELMLHLFRRTQEMIKFSLQLIPDSQSELTELSEKTQVHSDALLLTYDTLAAIFRYKEYSINQGDLFVNTPITDLYIKAWINWFIREVNDLKISSVFVRYLSKTILYHGSDAGRVADSQLNNYIIVSYNCEEWLKSSEGSTSLRSVDT